MHVDLLDAVQDKVIPDSDCHLRLYHTFGFLRDALWIKGLGFVPLSHLISSLVWDHIHWMDRTQVCTSFEYRARIYFTGDFGFRSIPREGRCEWFRQTFVRIRMSMLNRANTNQSVAGVIRIWTSFGLSVGITSSVKGAYLDGLSLRPPCLP